MDDFFAEISSDEERRAEEQRAAEAAARKDRVQTEKTERYTTQVTPRALVVLVVFNLKEMLELC
jgi:hypothetical protein